MQGRLTFDLPVLGASGLTRIAAGLAGLLLAVAVGAGFLPAVEVWQRNPAFSHGPLLALMVAVQVVRQLWGSTLQPACRWWALAIGGLASLLYIGGFGGDVTLFKILGAVGLVAGAVGMLYRPEVARVTLAWLPLLFFTAPWPMGVSEMVAFPMQLVSTQYAASLGGLLGLTVKHEGVQLAALAPATGKVLYQVAVTRACSGLTTVYLLGAITYLTSMLTPGKLPGRVLFASLSIPLAIVLNSIRIASVLATGVWLGPEVARWLHDQEALVVGLSAGLILFGLRTFFFSRRPPVNAARQKASEVRTARGRKRAAWPACLLVGLTLFTLGAATWVSRRSAQPALQPQAVAALQLPFPGCRPVLNAAGTGDETPQYADALVRRFEVPGSQGDWIRVVLAAGKERSVLHSPLGCLGGWGWECSWEGQRALELPGQRVILSEAILRREKHQILISWLYTDGLYTHERLLPFQVYSLADQLLGAQRVKAMVRITTPMDQTLDQTRARRDEFSRAVLPQILAALRRDNAESKVLTVSNQVR